MRGEKSEIVYGGTSLQGRASLHSGTSLRGALFATKQSIYAIKLLHLIIMDGLLRRKKRSSQRRPTVQHSYLYIPFIKLLLTLTFILSLNACMVGPNYKRPPAPLSSTFKEARGKPIIGNKKKSEWKIAQPADLAPRGEWWRMFHDPELNRLEAQLNHCNQSVWNAYENYKQSRAIVDEARASYYPTLSMNAAATRQRTVNGSGSFSSTSQTGSTTSGTATVGNPTNKTTSKVSTIHSLLFQASWVPDIWGLVSRQVEADISAAGASSALFAATRLSSQSSLAQYYFELRGTDSLQVFLNNTVTAYKKILKITKNQYASGVASRADVVQAQSQLEAAEALAINNGILRAEYEHAIAVLLGLPPAQLTLTPHPLAYNISPPAIPLILPCQLLERRPDVAQAERLMQQANAQIGIAIAAYFPTITLLGTASDTGTGLAHWFSLPMMAWAYGPQLSQLIYDGGLRSATVKAAKAGYLASVASYRQVVLAAFQNVEDNLSSLRILSKEMIVQNKAVGSAKKALQLTVNEYQSGTVAYSSVLTSQIAAFTAEQNAVTINYQRMIAAVGLVTALGGGWSGYG